MMRVMIAEDEEKVCQLIVGLVNWGQLDMEIVGVAQDGIEALEKIKVCGPDLLITDIRMPGCDGLELIRLAKTLKEDLEFIIISGYRHFDYAQNAIKYGVGDYLLKPIKQDVLLASLHKMRSRYKQRMERLSHEESLQLRLKNDIDKLRNNLFIELLMNKGTDTPALQQINERYHFSFQPGYYQIFAIKIDCVYEDAPPNDAIKLLEEKIVEITNHLLKDHCLELGIYSSDSYTYGVMNYSQEKRKSVRENLRAVLDDLMAQEAVFESFALTIGVGTAVKDVRELKDSFEAAKYAVRQRILLGTGKFIEAGAKPEPSKEGHVLMAKLNKSMYAAIEVLDKDALLNCIAHLKEEVMASESLDGDMIYAMVEQACELFVLHLRNLQFAMDNGEQWMEHFRYHANRIGAVKQLFEYLSDALSKAMDAVIEEQRQKETRPIRIAKQYIQQHYMKSLTLEEVSQVVGFNPTYFSTLFKKVSNSNFIDYLTEVRMNRAKELLRETDLSIASICEQTGYHDLKHFTKTFKKFTELKPSEYRKLYS